MISTDTPANVTPGTLTAHRRPGRRGRAAACWALAYLAVSGILLLVSGHVWTAVLHVALVALLIWAMAATTTVAQRVLDIAPTLIVVAFAYGEVALLVSALSTSFRDATIQHWDLALFGFQPSHELAARVPVRAISELLHAGYMSYYLALTIPPLLLYARREMQAFEQTTLTLCVTWLVACALFVTFPVAGPRFLWRAPIDVPDGPFRRLAMSILAAGSVRGTAFPSLHMAASLSQTVMAWRWQTRWVKIAMITSTALVGIGAVYAGFHYAVDMLAGAALGTITTTAVIAQSSSRAEARR